MEKLESLTKTPVFIKTFKFGKHRGKDTAEVAKDDMGYLNWMKKEKKNLTYYKKNKLELEKTFKLLKKKSDEKYQLLKYPCPKKVGHCAYTRPS